ncbi:hypothetical protein [Streptomyces sp. NBC_00233]|nr:hypothetical protein [Streptomyces sp. NBC_00233]MCX5232656.1 hypothetical protein [Streptomyces sp. NBC_00233]
MKAGDEAGTLRGPERALRATLSPLLKEMSSPLSRVRRSGAAYAEE